MSYKVIHAFTDLQDNNHVYLVGDVFPRENKKISNERLQELSGIKNRIGEPLIEAVEDDFAQHMNPPEECELPFVTVPDKQYTKTEINRMSTAYLKKLASNIGIEDAESMTGAELKKHLIDVFGL